MTPDSFSAWLDRVSALRIASSGGVPAPYQPIMLMAGLIQAASQPDTTGLLTATVLGSRFEELRTELCPAARKPDSTKMPMGALGKAEVWECRQYQGASGSVATAFRRGLRGRELMALSDHVELPRFVVDHVRASKANLVDLLLAVAQRHRACLDANGFVGLDALADHRIVNAAFDSEASTRFGSEADVEEALVDDWNSTPFAAIHNFARPIRQHRIGGGYLDILAYRKANDLLIVELKRNDPADKVVGQLARYVGAATLELEGRSRANRVQGVILTNEVTPKLEAAVAGADRFGLWTYNDQLTLEHVAGPSLQ